MKKTGFTPFILGGSSLLVIFAVLSLTVFALLSVSTVQADARLGDKSRAAIADFYEAEAEAETILARLRAGELPPEVTQEGSIYTYRCEISPTQALMVEVSITGDQYTISRWQVVSTTQWQPDHKLPVWTDGT